MPKKARRFYPVSPGFAIGRNKDYEREDITTQCQGFCTTRLIPLPVSSG
jgi:hypothetical protein